MSGHFKITAKTNLQEVPVGYRFEESDYASTTPDGQFVQFKYIEEEHKPEPTIVKPGIFAITYEGNKIVLQTTEFVKEDILADFLETENVSNRMSKFFDKLHVYKKYGEEVPKRGILLFGPPGCGKTTSIKKICNEYVADKKTVVILWPSDKISANDVKDFIKGFEYVNVEKMILVIEDLGGIEVDEVKVESRSSLLSLLDNQEKTFKIPVLILATTNHAEIFNGNISNRPKRFSEKIKVDYPQASARKQLFKFFLKELATPELMDKITAKKYDKFSPAHIQEIAIRAELYDLTIEQSMDEISAEIKQFQNLFAKEKRTLGINEEY